MLLTLSLISLVIIIGVIILVNITKYSFLMLISLILVPLWIIPINILPKSPVTDYPYKTTVFMNDNGWKTEICFKDFTQENNIVTIPEYTTGAWHWSDWQSWDVHTKPLHIKLEINDEFQYKSRNPAPVNYDAIQ